MRGSLCVGSWETSYKTGPLLGLKKWFRFLQKDTWLGIDGPNLAFMIANLESLFNLEKNREQEKRPSHDKRLSN